MAYGVNVAPSARRQLRRLPRAAQGRILDTMEALGTYPRPRGAVKLEASLHLYRVRVGDYRIIYRISDNDSSVLVLKIGHRGDVYKGWA
jgi:mRNA interferase RelE/StbE